MRFVFDLDQKPLDIKTQSFDAYDQIVVLGSQKNAKESFMVTPLLKAQNNANVSQLINLSSLLYSFLGPQKMDILLTKAIFILSNIMFIM